MPIFNVENLKVELGQETYVGYELLLGRSEINGVFLDVTRPMHLTALHVQSLCTPLVLHRLFVATLPVD